MGQVKRTISKTEAGRGQTSTVTPTTGTRTTTEQPVESDSTETIPETTVTRRTLEATASTTSVTPYHVAVSFEFEIVLNGLQPVDPDGVSTLDCPT